LHIKKRLGWRLATEIARRDVIAALNDIADAVTPITANRCLSIISAVFTWGVSVELVEVHPAMRIPKPGKETVRDRVLSDLELKAIWNALSEIIADRREGMTPRVARLIQILILTGQRKSEVANAPVAEFAGDLWTIPASRMKSKRVHVVPLAPLAR
jgi:integrase